MYLSKKFLLCKMENDFVLSLLPSSTRSWIGAHDGEQVS